MAGVKAYGGLAVSKAKMEKRATLASEFARFVVLRGISS